MALVTRGRLSVQRVDEKTWGVIQQMADKGGWDADTVTRAKVKARPAPAGKSRKTRSTASKTQQAHEDEDEEEDAEDAPDDQQIGKPAAINVHGRGRKRKAEEDHDEAAAKSNPRRSTRARK